MSFRVWAVRAGGDSEADPLFIENGQIAVSFRDANEDLSALPAQRAAFKDVVRANDKRNQARRGPDPGRPVVPLRP